MSLRVGVDVGGTFTDCVIVDEATGNVFSRKVFSRPAEPGLELEEGIKAICDQQSLDLGDVEYFVHGTTVAVNTLIQRAGAKLALVTTEGFADLLELGRLKTSDMYNVFAKRPTPVISRSLCFGIPERIDSMGNVLVPMDVTKLRSGVDAAVRAGAVGVVVAFLNSYRNPRHEFMALDLIRNWFPGLDVYASSRVWPVIREYERAQTSAVAAYVGPAVTSYLDKFEGALKRMAIRATLDITKSNGGVMAAEAARSNPGAMLLSGTAAGAVGAGYVARMCGATRAISLDVGGTSADIAIIQDGYPRISSNQAVGDFSIYMPSVDVTSVGQGGGSVAWLDDLGALRVGPRSAGSEPGPACYRRGGVEPTTTDAFAICGYLGDGDLGYGAVKLDRSRASEAMRPISDALHVRPEEAAEKIIDVAVSAMYANINNALAGHGVNPVDAVIVAFGGAGPMFACHLLRELGAREAVIPRSPGVLSAMGGLVADVRSDFVRSIYQSLDDISDADLRSIMTALDEEAVSWLRDVQGSEDSYTIEWSADMRYEGQGFDLEVGFPAVHPEDTRITMLRQAFEQEHERVYGYVQRSEPVSMINLRAVIVVPTRLLSLDAAPDSGGTGTASIETQIWSKGKWTRVPVYSRRDLNPESVLCGPTIVRQEDCTTVILEGFEATVDDHANLRIQDVKLND